MAFIIKRRDTRPVYRVTLYDFFGTPQQVPIDLTNATSVHLIMRKKGTATGAVRRAMTFVDREAGELSYAWIATDTATAGDYDVEFEITWSDGGKETVPNDGYMTVSVKADLDD